MVESALLSDQSLQRLIHTILQKCCQGATLHAHTGAAVFLDRCNQSHISFLYQITDQDTVAGSASRHRKNPVKIALDQPVLSTLIAA